MNCEKSLNLHFNKDACEAPHLTYAHLVHPADGLDCQSVRSKRYAVPGLSAGCFEWSSGTQAVMILLLRAALQRFSDRRGENLAGDRTGAVLAKVLINLLHKTSASVYSLFGCNAAGRSNLRRAFVMPLKSCSTLKNRYVFLNESFLGPRNIRLFLNGKEILREEAFRQFVAELEKDWLERRAPGNKNEIFAMEVEYAGAGTMTASFK